MLRVISRISSELPMRNTAPPSRQNPGLLSGRQREMLPLLHSFLSNGLEMYYYANVNFDTEFKKRLLEFVFVLGKKKPRMWSSLLLNFCHVNCNYAFCKRGRAGRWGSNASCIFVQQFLCPWGVHGVPVSWQGREGGEQEEVVRWAQGGGGRPWGLLLPAAPAPPPPPVRPRMLIPATQC